MNSESVSNIETWKRLHVEGYFRNHPCYAGGIKETGWRDVKRFQQLLGRPLNPSGWMAVIGCGYGRESKHFAGWMARVYGIDVLPEILDWAEEFVRSPRFIPILAENYKRDVPDVDYVYSHSVFQHMPHELTIDYIETFKAKLKPEGSMIVQFVEHEGPDSPDAKPEPVYSWTRRELKALFGDRTLIGTANVPGKKQLEHYVLWPHDFNT